MKRLFSVGMAVVLLVCILTGCSDQGGNQQGGSSSDEDPTVVNLMDMYSIKDPEGVEYDQRTALYMPFLESDEHYADGARHAFCVFYGKDGKGVYMYNIELFDSEESAAAYKDRTENGEVDGTAYIVESNADFFAAMESFIPDLQTWIDNSMASGMIEVD